MRLYSFLMIVLTLVILAAIGINYWPIQPQASSTAIKGNEKEDLQEAQNLVESHDPDGALEIIAKYKNEIASYSQSGKKWAELFIQANEQTNDSAELTRLYEYWPDSLEGHEKGALLVAENYIVSGQAQKYEGLRQKWRGSDHLKSAWFILDADALLLQGKRKEALAFLQGQTFEGKNDTGRLLRLALLNASEQPKVAWDYLTEAYRKDPKNPDIYSYRGKLLEAVGKNSYALDEYITATDTDPKNVYLKDQLADFLLRNGQANQALDIWKENLRNPSLDIIWVKALFWGHVVTPIKFDWKSSSVPQGKLTAYVNYLLSLKPGQYWDAAAFVKIADNGRLLHHEQSAFWLQLIQALKNEDENEAARLLQNNSFSSVSWNPQLETALKRILAFKRTGSFTLPEDASSEGKELSNTHHFFRQLETHAHSNMPLPPDLRNLLSSPMAYTAAFLAANWYEASLQLNDIKIIPPSYPDWLANALTHALKVNRGVPEALDYATAQKQTPSLGLQIAELFVSAGSPDMALDILSTLAKRNDSIGSRSSLLLSFILIEKGKLGEAKAAILDQPRLANDILGQETLARIALLENNIPQAEQIYIAIEARSAEAKSYLARKAFANGNWKRARELTEKLLEQFPQNALLRDNMKKITEEESKQTNTNQNR